MILADVIWAPNWPYWYSWVPLSATIGFVAEFFVFHLYERRCQGWRRSLGWVAVANLTSFIVGFVGLAFIALALPGRSFMVPQPLGFPPWDHYHVIFWQFFVAYLVSVLVEFGVYRLFSRRRVVHRLLAATFMSNLASYAVIFVGFLMLWAPSFRSPDEWLRSLFHPA